MFKIQLYVSLAFLVVVLGNPAQNVVQYDCARLRPITITPEEAAGEWFGMEIYKNIGVGNRHVDASTMCLAANVTSVNSTRIAVTLYSINGAPEFDSDKFVYGDLDASGRIPVEGEGGHTHLVIAEKNKKYLTAAFCRSKPGLTFTPVEKIVTYRYGGQPDLTPQELRAMHEVIKSNLGIETLQVGKLHCRAHGKH